MKRKTGVMHSQRGLHHYYSGSREMVDRLISWLLDNRYWLEASYHVNSFTVTCGVSPYILEKARFKVMEPGN